MSSRLRIALLAWAGWTGIALLFVLYVMLPSPASRDLSEWGRATAWQLVSWWSWVPWTLAVAELMKRAVAITSPPRLALVHLGAGVGIAGACAALQWGLRWLSFSGVRAGYEVAGASSLALADQWSLNVVVYGMLVGVFYALRAGRLESQLAQARVDVLTARMRPHFLFNTLNTISTLVAENPKAANDMIGRLSTLLRQAFATPDSRAVTLEEELELLQHYVAIQEARFGDRARVVFQVEAGTLLATAPPLLLQPLVENAIAHGLAGRPTDSGAITIEVHATRVGHRLRLVVQDDGPGFRAGSALGGGIGLAGTRARLTDLYGAAYLLDLRNAATGGAVVTIEIPFRTDAVTDR